MEINPILNDQINTHINQPLIYKKSYLASGLVSILILLILDLENYNFSLLENFSIGMHAFPLSCLLVSTVIRDHKLGLAGISILSLIYSLLICITILRNAYRLF